MAEVQITVPVAEEPCAGYCPREFMVTGLADAEHCAFHRIRHALIEQVALVDGRPVADSRDTIRWILQQIPAA